jgi:GT2 family glycosyltransferase
MPAKNLEGSAVNLDNPGAIRIAVLITCFNRRDVTLRCLKALSAQDVAHCDLRIFVVDDGSKDGTYETISAAYPNVRLLRGTGDLFWTRGMHLAFSVALEENFDYYLWLNDDTILMPFAISSLLDAESKTTILGKSSIIVGNTSDPITQEHTYGGMLKGRGLRPAAFRLAPFKSDSITPCDTMNGNCTLIPRAAAMKVGNLDNTFQHNFGDVDYGLRAKSLGCAIYMAPGILGQCSSNTDKGTWKDQSASLQKRWTLLNSPKGCPWREWVVFTKRHLGVLWPLYAASPYIKTILQSIIRGKLK